MFSLLNLTSYPLIRGDRSSSASFLDPTPQINVVLGRVDIIPFGQAVNWRVIHLVVGDCPTPIFDGIFDSGHDDNHNQRNGIETRIVGTENGEELEIHQYMGNWVIGIDPWGPWFVSAYIENDDE